MALGRGEELCALRWVLATLSALAGLVLAGNPARAQGPASTPGSTVGTERRAVSAAQVLLRRKQYRAAIELVKPLLWKPWEGFPAFPRSGSAGQSPASPSRVEPQLSSSPEARALTLLLAAAYLGENNAFWAIRTLAPRLEADPNDCELRVWLAWACFQVAELDRAREALDHASCRQPGSQSARASLLLALMAKTEGKDQAAAADLAQARAAQEMYAADRDALLALAQQIDPNRIPELAWKLDLRQGFTSNALLGSPTDPNATATIRDTASGYYQLSGWLRLSPDLHLPVRPALEAEARTFQLDNPEISALSYVSLTGRLGGFVGLRFPRLFVAWRPEYLRLAGGALATTGPNWYAGAQRAEAELELMPWLLAFAGGGRRDFRPMIRDRYELDGGFGGQVPMVSRLSMVWAVSGRKHWTDHGTYDLWGGTGLLNLLYTFERGFQPRAGVTLAGDYYPHWNGYLAPVGATENRRDLFVKVTAALWSPLVSGFRFGVLYDYSHRGSTAHLFEFSDHRASVLLTWSGTTELLGPAVAPSLPLTDIAWGLGGADGRLQERVQDYLREDERTLQRSCGCRE